MNNDYKANVIRIWQKIKEYKESTPIEYFKVKFLKKSFLIARLIIVGAILIHMVVTIICFKYKPLTDSNEDFGNYVWKDYFGKYEVLGPIIAFLIGYLIFYYIYLMFESEKMVLGFEKVKDIVRGTVNTGGSINDLYSAYEHFKSTPGVEIIDIKDVEKLNKL